MSATTARKKGPRGPGVNRGGRPPKQAGEKYVPSTVSLDPERRAHVEDFARANNIGLGEAIRQLIDLGLPKTKT